MSFRVIFWFSTTLNFRGCLWLSFLTQWCVNDVLFEHVQEESLRYNIIQRLCVRDQTYTQVGMKIMCSQISVLVVVTCHFNSIFTQPTFAIQVSCFTAADSNEFAVA
jgi:hypothetical protein